MEPNKENIRKWVDALRSGNYEQGTGYLATDNGFCCLGVLCEVARKEGAKINKSYLCGVYYYDEQPFHIPKQLCPFVGLSYNPLICFPYCSYSLTELNDNGFTFSQIADIIEWYYL